VTASAAPDPPKVDEILDDTTRYLAAGVNPPKLTRGEFDSVTCRVTTATPLDGRTFLAEGVPVFRADDAFWNVIDGDRNTPPNVVQVLLEESTPGRKHAEWHEDDHKKKPGRIHATCARADLSRTDHPVRAVDLPFSKRLDSRTRVQRMV
jgi:hypothetical protein